jgi:hypothetical protein
MACKSGVQASACLVDEMKSKILQSSCDALDRLLCDHLRDGLTSPFNAAFERF